MAFLLSTCDSIVPAPPTATAVAMWVQDAASLRCLECSREMTFLAQHDNLPLHEEGAFYGFFCGACRITAVNYQQT